MVRPRSPVPFLRVRPERITTASRILMLGYRRVFRKLVVLARSNESALEIPKVLLEDSFGCRLTTEDPFFSWHSRPESARNVVMLAVAIRDC